MKSSLYWRRRDRQGFPADRRFSFGLLAKRQNSNIAFGKANICIVKSKCLALLSLFPLVFPSELFSLYFPGGAILHGNRIKSSLYWRRRGRRGFPAGRRFSSVLFYLNIKHQVLFLVRQNMQRKT